MLRRGLMIAILLACTAPALAQTPATRIRGTIAQMDGSVLKVVTRDGPTVAVALPGGLQPTALKRLTMDAIQPNSFVATVAAPAADGTLQSTYVRVFPESMRGQGEGHSDWDLGGGTTMTNATVTSIVQATAGRKLTMVYKGQPIDIVVPPDTPILTDIPATRDDLKPGAQVYITATKSSEGIFTATRLTVGKDGVNPPQ
jgi:hypothetical protein